MIGMGEIGGRSKTIGEETTISGERCAKKGERALNGKLGNVPILMGLRTPIGSDFGCFLMGVAMWLGRTQFN